jgi:hypothetical protein
VPKLADAQGALFHELEHEHPSGVGQRFHHQDEFIQFAMLVHIPSLPGSPNPQAATRKDFMTQTRSPR